MLTIITGSMFSGKTSELFRLYKRACLQNKECIMVYPQMIDMIKTHDGDIITEYCNSIGNSVSTNDNTLQCSVKKLKIVDELLVERFESSKKTDYDKTIIFIDEGHLFPDTYKFCVKWMKKCKIIMTTLTTDYKYEPYTEIGKLLCYATKIKKLTSICMKCKVEEGVVNHRTVDNTEDVLVGGKDVYEPLCINCYKDLTKGT